MNAASAKSLERRYRTTLGILVAAAVVSFVFLYPSESIPQVRYAERLPKTVDSWIGEDLPVDEVTIAILETDDVLIRQYQRSNDPPILLAVVFAQENRKVAHPPEVCLEGGGWEVESKSVDRLKDNFPVMRLVTAKGTSRQLYLYWYKSGDFFTESYLRQQLNIAWGHLVRHKSSASLIRLSTPVIGDDYEGAEQRLREFGLHLLPSIILELP